MEGLFLLLVLIGLYFLPAIIAASRDHHQIGSIVIINIYLGWTFVGWLSPWLCLVPPSKVNETVEALHTLRQTV